MGRSLYVVGAMALSLVSACKRKPEPTSVPVATSSEPVTSASAAPPPASAAPARPVAVTWSELADVKECNAKAHDLDPALPLGTLGIAARGKDFGVATFFPTKSKEEAMLAFSGYDGLARTVGPSHGLGKALLFPPRVFPRGKDTWLVVWFDRDGLAFTKTGWAATLPDVEHLTAVRAEEAPHTSIAMTKNGSMLAAAQLSPDPAEQIGLFLFAPVDAGAEPVKALGGTHHAHNPEHSTVAEVEGGYLVAWEDQPGGGKREIAVTGLDANGKERGNPAVLSSPGKAASRPSMVATKTGALIAWAEADASPQTSSIVVAAVDPRGRPSGAPQVVSAGTAPTLGATPTGAVLGFVRASGSEPARAAIVAVDANGAPHARGVLVSDVAKGKGAIVEHPVLAESEEGRVGVVYVYADGMKAQLKTVLATCLQ